MWSVWRAASRKSGHFWSHSAKSLFHYTAQNNSPWPLRWNDPLFFWNYLWKILNNGVLFLAVAFPAQPRVRPPPPPWPCPLPRLQLWAGFGNPRSHSRGQPAGHCYSRPPSGSLFLLWHCAIRTMKTKDDKWRSVGGGKEIWCGFSNWQWSWSWIRKCNAAAIHPEWFPHDTASVNSFVCKIKSSWWQIKKRASKFWVNTQVPPLSNFSELALCLAMSIWVIVLCSISSEWPLCSQCQDAAGANSVGFWHVLSVCRFHMGNTPPSGIVLHTLQQRVWLSVSVGLFFMENLTHHY